MKRTILSIFCFLSTSYSMARGVVSFTGRSFFESPKEFQASTEFITDVRVEEKLRFDSLEVKFNLIASADHRYRSSSYVDVNEAYIGYEYNKLFISAGYHIFNWTSMESFQPADIVNSQVLDSDVESIKKLGELALNASYLTDFGILKFYIFPKVKENFLPQAQSRVLDGTRPVTSKVVLKEEVSDSLDHLQYGFGFEETYDDLELKINILKSINRNFAIVGYQNYSLVPNVGIVPSSGLETFYFDSLNITTSGTYFIGEHTLKFEYVFSSPDNKDIELLTANGVIRNIDRSLLALGYEYQINHSGGLDSMFFLEYQRALKGNERVKQELYIFQNDFFLGHRLSFNDAYAMELFSGFFYDLKRDEMFYLINFSRRINDQWKFKVGYRGYQANESDNLGLSLLDGDDEVYLTLYRYF